MAKTSVYTCFREFFLEKTVFHFRLSEASFIISPVATGDMSPVATGERRPGPGPGLGPGPGAGARALGPWALALGPGPWAFTS